MMKLAVFYSRAHPNRAFGWANVPEEVHVVVYDGVYYSSRLGEYPTINRVPHRCFRETPTHTLNIIEEIKR